MANTGFKGWGVLEEYYIATGQSTGVTKPNLVGDPDYIPPVQDFISCPRSTFTFTRTVNFIKECTGGSGSIVPFSKTYSSIVSQADAEYMSNNDPTFNSEGQENANTLGVCTVITYIWGRVEETEVETVQGVQYAKIMLRTYKGTSDTVPPTGTLIPIVCTSNNIPMGYYQDGTYSNLPNLFNTSLNNESEKQMIPPNTAGSNPRYPKQMIYLPNGGTGGVPLNLWVVFKDKAEGSWQLLQTVNL